MQSGDCLRCEAPQSHGVKKRGGGLQACEVVGAPHLLLEAWGALEQRLQGGEYATLSLGVCALEQCTPVPRARGWSNRHSSLLPTIPLLHPMPSFAGTTTLTSCPSLWCSCLERSAGTTTRWTLHGPSPRSPRLQRVGGKHAVAHSHPLAMHPPGSVRRSLLHCLTCFCPPWMPALQTQA